MSFYLRQRWNDSRLSYNGSHGIDVIELDTRMMDQIWTPDIYIINEKDARFHYVTMPNRMMYLYPDGDVLYSSRWDVNMFSICDSKIWGGSKYAF